MTNKAALWSPEKKLMNKRRTMTPEVRAISAAKTDVDADADADADADVDADADADAELSNWYFCPYISIWGTLI